jgi:hypothetical protein
MLAMPPPTIHTFAVRGSAVTFGPSMPLSKPGASWPGARTRRPTVFRASSGSCFQSLVVHVAPSAFTVIKVPSAAHRAMEELFGGFGPSPLSGGIRAARVGPEVDNHEHLEAIRRALEAAPRHPQEAVHPGLAAAEPRWAQSRVGRGSRRVNARPAAGRCLGCGARRHVGCSSPDAA